MNTNRNVFLDIYQGLVACSICNEKVMLNRGFYIKLQQEQELVLCSNCQNKDEPEVNEEEE